GDLLPIGLSQHRALRAHPVLLVGSMSPTIYTKINCFHRLGSRAATSPHRGSLMMEFSTMWEIQHSVRIGTELLQWAGSYSSTRRLLGEFQLHSLISTGISTS
ncbi:MAG: hypothetical protein ACT4RN_07165, partial [Pseudonocardia sp.]